MNINRGSLHDNQNVIMRRRQHGISVGGAQAYISCSQLYINRARLGQPRAFDIQFLWRQQLGFPPFPSLLAGRTVKIIEAYLSLSTYQHLWRAPITRRCADQQSTIEPRLPGESCGWQNICGVNSTQYGLQWHCATLCH